MVSIDILLAAIIIVILISINVLVNRKQPKTKVLTGLAMVLALAPIVFFSAQALLLPLDAFGARVVTTILTTAVVLNGMTLIVFTLFRQR